MRRILNDKGITLVELLASIVILSIVIISIGSYFVNATKYSTASDNRLSNAQTAYNVLNVYKDQFSFINLNNESFDCIMGETENEEDAINRCFKEADASAKTIYIGNDYETLGFSDDILEQLESVQTTVTKLKHPNKELKNHIVILGITVKNTKENISEEQLVGYIRGEISGD